MDTVGGRQGSGYHSAVGRWREQVEGVEDPTLEEEHERLGLCPWCIGSESLNRDMTYEHMIADKGYGEFDALRLEGAECAEVG
jgi:hypothetical protein